MIQTSPTMRILAAVEPVDFRRGIDGLAAICRQRLERDPMNAAGPSSSAIERGRLLPPPVPA